MYGHDSCSAVVVFQEMIASSNAVDIEKPAFGSAEINFLPPIRGRRAMSHKYPLDADKLRLNGWLVLHI
jgi:hypothetical protein